MTTDPRSAEFFARLHALGKAITPPMIVGTIELYSAVHSREPMPEMKITRDLRYGDAERHRLDVYSPQASGPKRPVLVYVHGGGFVGGDKVNPNTPFFENIGRWAVRNGLVGVAMTYRLAPEHRWPSGSDDVSRAMSYLREHIAEYGGDPERIFIIGQSAGAVHVGGYIAREHSGSKSGWRPAGVILVSGLYDTATMERNRLFDAYFSGIPEIEKQNPFLADLARTDVPLMSVIGEFEPMDFLRQFNKLNEAYLQHHERLPRIAQLRGHNHLSTVFHLNTSDESLAAPLLEFVHNPGADPAATGRTDTNVDAVAGKLI
jgi:acetyl esterase/lipase